MVYPVLEKEFPRGGSQEGDILIRKYQKEDRRDLCELIREIHGVKVKEDYWEWKYERNPLGYHASYVAIHKGRVIGLAGGILRYLSINGKVVVAGQVVDLMIRSEYRGRLFSLMRKSLEDLRSAADVLYGVANEMSTKVYIKIFHFSMGFHLQRLDKILNIKPYIGQLLKLNENGMIVHILGILGNKTLRLFSYSSILPSQSVSVKEISFFDERFDSFGSQVKKKFEIVTIRDSRYLNWRYFSHPIFEYKALVVEEGNDILGFIILSCREEFSKTMGLILDVVVFPDRLEILRLLLSRAIKFFIERGVDVITCWMPSHCPYYGILRKYLFVPRTTSRTVLTRSNCQDISKVQLKDPINWYVTMGDDDSF